MRTPYYQLKQFIQLHYKYYWSAQRCVWTDLCADIILILSIETIYTITCGPYSVRIDGCLCGPHINFRSQSDRQRRDSTVGLVLSFRLQGSGFEPPTHHLGIWNSRPIHTVLYRHCLLF